MYILFLCGLAVFSVLAVFARDLLRSVICLMAASIFLALVFFRLHAPYAGVFEISVVAGLIMVLFITTISLTKTEGEVRESGFAPILFGVLLIGFFLIYMRSLPGIVMSVCSSGVVEQGDFGKTLWTSRAFDLIGQIGIIFAGVFVVLSLFRKKNGEKHG